MRHFISLIMLAMILTLLVGCGSSQINIYVESVEATNQTRPFYMVVRMTDQKNYVTESYQEVAAGVFNDPQKSVLKTAVIYPGKPTEIALDPETITGNVSLGVYFLFTQPGERWKSFIPPPIPLSIYFELEGSNIKSQN